MTDVFVQEEVNPYLLDAPISEDWYVLKEEDIDPNDVLLRRIAKHIPLMVPPYVNYNGEHISRTIDGLALQQLINFEVPWENNSHRNLTQLRELRDCSYCHPEINFEGEDANALCMWWIESDNARRFAYEYKELYQQKKELDELIREVA